MARFYDDQLGQRGWILNNAVAIRGTSEASVRGWTKAGLVFRLGFYKATDPRNPAAGKYATVYSIDLHSVQ